MKTFIFTIFISLFSYSAFADEVTINSHSNNMLTGLVNNDIATNFDPNSQFRNIYWQLRSGAIVSNKPYFLSNTTRSISVRFCVQNTNQVAQCSGYVQVRKQRASRSIQLNSGNITHDVNGGENLNVGDTFWSTSVFNVLQGQFSFLYHQVEDQDGNVLSASFTENSVSTLSNITLPTNTVSVRACSIGGFTHGLPTSISNCSQPIDVIDANAEPVYETNSRMFYTHWGPFNSRQEGKDACSNSTYANYSDWRLVRSHERPMTVPLNLVREAPYNLKYTGEYEAGVGMAEDTFFYWTYATTGQIVEHKFIWSPQQITYGTAICTRLK